MKTKACPCPQCSKKPTYTRAQVRDHVRNSGAYCPNCGSTLVKTSKDWRKFPARPMSCRLCKHKWFDVYKLAGLEPRE